MTTFGTKMVYRKYSKNYTVIAYNFTFYPHSCLDITYCSRYKISNEGTCQHEKIVYYYVCKNWRKFIICAHVKWSILPHLNVKRYCENVGNEGNNCFHFVHNCQHNLNGIYIYHGIRCQEYILTPYFITSMQV